MYSEKTFLIFPEMELSGSNIKKFLIFSQKKAFLIFLKKKTPKKSLIFREKELSYISGSNFPSSKNLKQKTKKEHPYISRNRTFQPQA